MFGKKEKLETEKFDLDADLNFDDFSMDDLGLNEGNPKSRSPVYDVASGALGAVKSKFTDPGFLHSAIKSVLPPTYGEITKAIDSGASGMVSLYDDAVKEVKPQIARIAKKIDKLVPEEAKRIKAVTSKISDFLGNEARFRTDYKESQQDQSVANSLAEVFGAQQEAENSREARTAAEDKIKENIEKKRFSSNFGILSTINDNIGKLARYNEKVNQAFQRKTLELQFRSYFVQAEMLEEQRKYHEISRAQNEAIAKNTALPEFVKIKSSEKFAELAKNKFFGALQSGIFGDGDMLKTGIKRLKTDVMSYMRGLSTQLEMAQMGLDSAESALEANRMAAANGMGLSTAEMAGGLAGGQILDWGKDKFTEHVNPFIEKHKPTTELLAKGANIVANIPGSIRAARSSEKFEKYKARDDLGGKLARGADKLLGYFTERRPSGTVDHEYRAKSLDQPAMFDIRVHKSIVDIIPGFLARIHQELVMTRTKGKKPALLTYDFQSDKFKTPKEIGDNFIGRLDKTSKRSMHGFYSEMASNDLFRDASLDDKESLEAKKFLSKLSSRANFGFTPENMMSSPEFTELDPSLGAKLKAALDSYIEADDSPAANQLKLTNHMRGLHTSTTDLRGEAEMFIKAGYGEILAERGLATREEDGSYELNNEALIDFAREHGIVTSDIHAKKNIKKVMSGKLSGTLASVNAGNAKRARSKGAKPKRDMSLLAASKKKHAIAKKKNAPSIKDKLLGKLNSITGNKLSGKASLEAIKKTRIYKWFYKAGKGDDKEHIGPMAQDVKANMGNDAAPGGTCLDITTMNGVTMGAIQELADRQNKQVESKGAVDILLAIKEDTSILAAGGGTGGPGGIGIRLGKNGSYLGLLSDIANSLGTLVGKGSKDLAHGVKKVYTTARDDYIKPTGKMIANLLRDAKDPATKAFKKMLTKGAELATSALDFGKKTLFDYIPAGLKKGKEYLTKAKNFIRDIINGPIDLYIKDRLTPVIRAELLKMGYYKDEITGKVIESLDDLNHIKGNIVNQYGEVVLTIEEAAKGLYDKYGNKVCATFTKVAKLAVGLALKGWGKAKKLGKFLLGGLGNLKLPSLAGLGDWLSKAVSNFGFGTDKIYNVLTEIRDIMKGRNPPDHEDKAEFDKNFVGPMPQSRTAAGAANLKGLASKASEFVANRLAPKGEHKEDAIDKGLDAAKGFYGNTKAKLGGYIRRLRGKDDDFVGPMPETALSKGLRKLKQRGESTKAKLGGYIRRLRGKDDDFVGPMPETALSKGLRKLKQHGESVKAKAEFDKNFVGPMPETAVSKGLKKLKQHGESAKAKAEFDKNFVGPKPKGLFGKLKSGVGGLLSSAKDAGYKAATAVSGGLQALNKEDGGVASSAMSMYHSLQESANRAKASKPKKPPVKKKVGKKATSKAQRVDSGDEDRNDAAEKSAEAYDGANTGPKYMSGNVFNTIGKGAMTAASAAKKASKYYRKNKDKIKNGIKDKYTSIKDTVKGKGKAILGALHLGKSKKDEEPEKPEEKDASQAAKKGRSTRHAARKAGAGKLGLTDKKATIKAAAKNSKVAAAKKKHALNDKDGDGKRDGNAEDRLKQIAEHKKANRNEDAEVVLDNRYKEANFIDTIAHATMKLFGMLGSGAAAVFGAIGSVLSMKTIGNMLSKVAGKGGVVSKVAKTAYSIAKSPVKSAVSLASKIGRPLATGLRAVRGAATVARVASVARMGLMAGSLLTGGTLSTILAGAGTALTAIGTALASPVVLGGIAIAATAYGVYKAYKYFTRDKANAYENIRLKQYGLNDSDAAKKNNHLIFQLEEYLLDGKIGYNEGKAYILDKKVDGKEMLSIFDIELEDTAKVDKFNEWMTKRFKPFFLTTLTALFAVDRKAKLKDVCDLDTDKRLKFLNLSKYEGGPYDVLISPFASLESLSSTKDITMQAVKAETDKIIEKMKKDGDFIAIKKQPPKPKAPPPPPKPKAPPKPKMPEAVAKTTPKGYTAISDDEDGKAMSKIMAAQNDPDKVASNLAKPKEAPGPISDGSNGSAYIKTQPKVTLDGLLPAYSQNFKAMAQEYGEITGKSMLVTSGVRTKEQQQALYNSDPTAAKPGRSLHEFGLALDINSDDLDKADDLGLMRKYGFTRPVGGEDWHMEPAGIQGNIKKAKEDPEFAEQATEASLFKGGGGYGATKGTPRGKRDTSGALALMDIAADKATIPAKKPDEALKPSPEVKSAMSLPREEDTIKMGTTAKRLPKVPEEETIKMGTTAKRLPTSIARNIQSSKIDTLTDTEKEPSSVSIDTSKGGSVQDTIIAQAKKAGADPGLMTAFAAVESGMNPNAKAKGTSASGAFQFLERTWYETVSKYGRKYGLDSSASPFDVNASTLMASEYVKSNIRLLKSVKSNPNITDVYLAHLLGPAGARAILKASPDSIAAEVLPKAAVTNRDLFYQNGRALTVREFYSLVQNRVATKAKRFGVNVGSGDISTGSTGSSTMDDDDPNSREVRRANGGSIALGRKNLPKTSLGDEAGFPAGFDESLFTTQAPSAMSQPNAQNTELNRGMGSETFGEMSSTLAKSLSVQEEIRDILQQILDNSASLEKGSTDGTNDQYEDTSRSDTGFGKSGGFQSAGSIIESAIDLRRRMA